MSDATKNSDGSSEGESRETELAQKDSSVKQEATITGTDKQQTWQDAFNVGHEHDQHPSEINGIPAVQSSFGIDFGDGRILTAKGPTQDGKKLNWIDGIGDAVKGGVKSLFCQDKGHEDAKMQYMHDFNAFYTTNLRQFGIDPFIIAGITRNEIEHRKIGIDDSQEE